MPCVPLHASRRTQRVIDSYTDHYIVCGYGRVGRQAVRDLRAEKARYVVVDDNPNLILKQVHRVFDAAGEGRDLDARTGAVAWRALWRGLARVSFQPR